MSTLERAMTSAAAGAGTTDFVALLDHLGTLRFSGDDAQTFLQGQLSCDLARVGPRSSSYGAYCTPKGRMLANFLLWSDEDGYAMALSRDIAQAVHKQLSRYVLRSKVKVSDASDEIALVGAVGGRSERTFAGRFPDLPAEPGGARRVAGVGTAVRLNDGRLFLALKKPIDGVTGPADARAWRWLDIRAGLPLVTAATQDQFVPQMVNLELIGGVSFDKGCYTGQEVVARAQHLGSVKRRMFLANVPAPARAGDALYSDDLGDQASGVVLNAEASPGGGYDLLAVVQTASRERSTVRLGSPGGAVLRFLPLPYAPA